MKLKKSIKLILKNKKYRHLVIVGNLSRFLYFKDLYFKNNSFNIFSEKWDHLIILDACRFDLFVEEIAKRKIHGKLEYRISSGSMTEEFLINNFYKNYFSDVVYVTANPFVNLLLKNKVYKIIPVWKFGWNDKLKTVHPKEVCKYALKARKLWPHKRLIIHFIQPHFPFIKYRFKEETGILEMIKSITQGKGEWMDIDVWDLFFDKKITLAEIIRGYKSNLEIVMDYVEKKILPYLDGKIVITSDHGEAFGERLHPLIPIRVYGHPRRCRIKSLIKVPWFVIEKEKKMSIDIEKVRIKNIISTKLKNKIKNINSI